MLFSIVCALLVSSLSASCGGSANNAGRSQRLIAQGARVVAASGCMACHRIGNDGNNGPGPDLTTVGRRLSREAITRALNSPAPPMPSYRGLPPDKFRASVAYLSSLRSRQHVAEPPQPPLGRRVIAARSGDSEGVHATERGGRYSFAFEPGGEALYRRLAGRVLWIDCSTVFSSKGREGALSSQSAGTAVRVPSGRRILSADFGVAYDYCQISLARGRSHDQPGSPLIYIALTGSGAAHPGSGPLANRLLAAARPLIPPRFTSQQHRVANAVLDVFSGDARRFCRSNVQVDEHGQRSLLSDCAATFRSEVENEPKERVLGISDVHVSGRTASVTLRLAQTARFEMRGVLRTSTNVVTFTYPMLFVFGRWRFPSLP
jgi:hypothetical protein